MRTSNNQDLRILIGALLIGLFIIGITAYNSYAEDMKKKVGETVVEMLPDVDNGLAQL